MRSHSDSEIALFLQASNGRLCAVAASVAVQFAWVKRKSFLIGRTVQVFIIVFKEEIDRKCLLAARFREIGLEPTFIDAIRGSELPDTEQQKFQGLSRYIWAKEAFRSNAIGCALSHFRAWERFLDSGARGAFVFEDDAKPIETQKSHIKSQLGRLLDDAAQFDIVFLANRQTNIKSKSRINAMSGLDLCCLKYSGVGAEGYFITKPAAERLLRNPLRWVLEVDTLMHHWWLNGSKVLYLNHPLFEEDGRTTSIGYETTAKPKGGNFFLGTLRRVNRLRWSIYKRLKFPFYLRSVIRSVM